MCVAIQIYQTQNQMWLEFKYSLVRFIMSRIAERSDLLELLASEKITPEYKKRHVAMLMFAWKEGEKKTPLTPMLVTDIYEKLTGYRAYRTSTAIVGGNVCPDPMDIPREMRELCQYYEDILNSGCATLQDACAFHIAYERLHPWPDGNGRTGRALLQYFAARSGLLPIMIRHRDQYLRSLDCAKVLAELVSRGG
jgi:Fic family protein